MALVMTGTTTKGVKKDTLMECPPDNVKKWVTAIMMTMTEDMMIAGTMTADTMTADTWIGKINLYLSYESLSLTGKTFLFL